MLSLIQSPFVTMVFRVSYSASLSDIVHSSSALCWCSGHRNWVYQWQRLFLGRVWRSALVRQSQDVPDGQVDCLPCCGMCPSQMGSHFQIFPELTGKCTLPKVNGVWLIFMMLFLQVNSMWTGHQQAFQCNPNMLGFEWANTLGKLHHVGFEAVSGIKWMWVSTCLVPWRLGDFMQVTAVGGSPSLSPTQDFLTWGSYVTLYLDFWGPRNIPESIGSGVCVYVSSEYIHFCSKSVPKLSSDFQSNL